MPVPPRASTPIYFTPRGAKAMPWSVDFLRKSRVALPLLLIVLTSGSCAVLSWITGPAVELRVMCFNIRNGHGEDGDNRWELRKDFVADVIRDSSSDIAALQEAHHFQLQHLLARLPEYRAAGVGRDGGTQGEYSPILYRHDRFELLETRTFWLSDTPETPSAHWGNRYRRICTWARLRDKQNGRSFYVYNTHLDHESQASRERSARLIMETIAARAPDEPFLLCGDLNSGEDNPVMGYLKGGSLPATRNPIPLVDTWRVVYPDSLESGTVSRFVGSHEHYKIDYILATRRTRVLNAEILRVNRNGRYPSDHYPVTAHLLLK